MDGLKGGAGTATARDIILEIVRNMREGLEPMHRSALAPAIYTVYLHREDLERLRGILPRIVEEASRALDEEVARLNRGGIRKLFERGPKIEPPAAGWRVEFFENTDEDVRPGDVVIYSELAVPARAEYGAGSMTKRIATRRMSGVETSSQKYEEKAEGGVFATIEYEDNGGRQTYRMTKNQIVIGRGGRNYWTDLKLDTLPDVSREHARLRRDPQSGKFFLKDMSRLGTTINGEKAPPSVDYSGPEKQDRNVEVELPSEARIGLADVVFLEFRAAGRP
ncbi:MAG: FHA domain-containing protein [Bryobacteraceae bacterium]